MRYPSQVVRDETFLPASLHQIKRAIAKNVSSLTANECRDSTSSQNSRGFDVRSPPDLNDTIDRSKHHQRKTTEFPRSSFGFYGARVSTSSNDHHWLPSTLVTSSVAEVRWRLWILWGGGDRSTSGFKETSIAPNTIINPRPLSNCYCLS
jgi:hypothetical protein